MTLNSEHSNSWPQVFPSKVESPPIPSSGMLGREAVYKQLWLPSPGRLSPRVILLEGWTQCVLIKFPWTEDSLQWGQHGRSLPGRILVQWEVWAPPGYLLGWRESRRPRTCCGEAVSSSQPLRSLCAASVASVKTKGSGGLKRAVGRQDTQFWSRWAEGFGSDLCELWIFKSFRSV